MKNIINAPVTIIPFDVFKLKILSFLTGTLHDIIKEDSTDGFKINHVAEVLKEFFNCNDRQIIELFRSKSDTLFDPIILPYYEKDSVMVFVELKGELIPLYMLREDELASYGDIVKIIA